MYKPPKAKTANIVIQESDKELLIYDLNTNRILMLNETAGFVWKNCDGANSTRDIAYKMAKAYRQEVSEEFVVLAINSISKEGLIEKNDLPEISRSTRRQMIRQTGLATMIALPLITTMTAPTAANAQSASCGGVDAVCLNIDYSQGTCCSGLRCLAHLELCQPCNPSGVSYTNCNTAGCCAAEITINRCCNSGIPIESPTGLPIGLPQFDCFCP